MKTPRSQAGVHFASLEVTPKLPHWLDRTEGSARIPADMINAKIVHFGAGPAEADLEAGGLIVDYVPAGATGTKRVAFAFNELGIWIEYSGDRRRHA